ncbi:MAG: GYF domain-containing protein [Anaeromyxobacter sp.]
MYAQNASATWYYEFNGQQTGPVTADAIRGLLAQNTITPATRVWTAGMSGWAPLSSVPQFGSAQLAAPAQRSPGFGPSTAAALPVQPHELEPFDVATVILLHIVTLGIYGLVKFFQAGKLYQRLARVPSSNFEALFWSMIACSVLGVLTSLVGIGFLFFIASFILSILALNELLSLRDRAVATLARPPQLTSGSTHKVLYIVGQITSLILVGVILLIVQGLKFLEDHNNLVAAFRAGGAQQRPAAPAAPSHAAYGAGFGPAPAQPQPAAYAPILPQAPAAPTDAPAPAPAPAAAPATRFCMSCGGSLSANARFCQACGAAVA